MLKEVSSELDLTNKQLFLTNLDLKPVKPERRQWKAMNFVSGRIFVSFVTMSLSQYVIVKKSRKVDS